MLITLRFKDKQNFLENTDIENSFEFAIIEKPIKIRKAVQVAVIKR